MVIAGNGRIAAELATAPENAGVFDLILMDMQMPELDGYGATARVREAGVKTPIVALTANAMAEDRARCLSVGCTDYLPKPVERYQLLSTAACYMGKSQRIPASQATAVRAPEAPQPAARQEVQAAAGTVGANPKYKALLDKFIWRLPERVATMTRLLQEQNLVELERAVHQLKGAGHGYGFTGITEIAARAEHRIRSKAEADTVRAEVDELVRLIRSVQGYDPKRETSTATATPIVAVAAAAPAPAQVATPAPTPTGPPPLRPLTSPPPASDSATPA